MAYAESGSTLLSLVITDDIVYWIDCWYFIPDSLSLKDLSLKVPKWNISEIPHNTATKQAEKNEAPRGPLKGLFEK